MSKKSEEIKTATLIIPKEEFKAQLEERIAKGRVILTINVGVVNPNAYIVMGYQAYKDKREDPNFILLKDEYNKWYDYNCELLKRSFDIPNNEYHAAYAINNQYMAWGLREDPVSSYKKTIEAEIKVLENLINKLNLIPSIADQQQPVEKALPEIKETKPFSKDIFIVHGHNEETKTKVARVLEKLKLHPVILHEQPNGGRTIIEKLEGESSDSGFAVVLLTADDKGNVKSSGEMNPRARQNVIFEMGYFIGKLGRNRVMALVEDGVETPGDISGVVYTPFDKAEGWKMQLFKELKAANYPIDANNLI
ncbi:MAG: nucleotide-binding protein [Muribaculaceae bacterium]|nr:nucleotide-binding protein [Muribaculaceae bacterium]